MRPSCAAYSCCGHCCKKGPEVGISYVEGTVRGPIGEERVRFLIDSGATYSFLPEAVWKKIGLTPKRD